MQSLRRLPLSHKLIIASVLALIVLGLGIFLLARQAQAPGPNSDAPTPSVTPGRVMLEGTIVCLPKKGTGPQTLECVYGLRDNNGKHYGLTNLGSNGQLQVNTRVKVAGDVVAPPAGTSYDISGTINVDTLEVISVPG